MPNIFKHFSLSKAEAYQFPDAEELIQEDEELSFQEVIFSEEGEERPEKKSSEPPPSKEENPISFAQVQADKILEDARQEAEAILEEARQAARRETEAIHEAAREEGRQEGLVQGRVQAKEETAKELEKQAAALEAEVQRFLDRAGAELDRQLDQNIDELRDLALAVAEKVICVSLKNCADVISRMIQTAIDKRKRREWVHIYIAECDAKRMGQVPASLSSALSALSNRVRIIPMADDESGTCIIEMPDEIIDASAGTQLNNIRSLLMDTPSGGMGSNLF